MSEAEGNATGSDTIPKPARGLSWRQLLGIPLNVLLFLLLMVMGWGSWDGFFAHPARLGVVVVHLALIPIMTLCTSGRDRGQQHVPDWKPFFPLLAAHSLFTAWVMPYMDARNLWVLPGGDLVRWAGFGIFLLGSFLRAGSMLVLGRRFVSVVAIQQDHSLTTTGIYAHVRHPSYLGIVLVDIGLAGVFRSAIGLLLLPVVFVMFAKRMDREEALLEQRFGDDYRRWAARTARLVPGLY